MRSMHLAKHLAVISALSILTALNASAATPPKFLVDPKLVAGEPLGVSIDDYVTKKTQIVDAPLLAKFFKSDDTRLFAAGESRCGIVLPEGSASKTLCGLAHLETVPVVSDDVVNYEFAFLMQTLNGPAFRKVNITVSGEPRDIAAVQVVQDIPLAETQFSIQAGLVSRTAVLTDVQHGLVLTFPIGNGGLDMGISSNVRKILTPLFEGASIERTNVIAQRGPLHQPTSPGYYREKPFMRLTNKNGFPTDIAFHITILGDGQWAKGKGSEFLVRGFDSHGCMRMRLKDLMEVYTIVMMGGSERVPVDVDYFVHGVDSDGRPNGTETSLNKAHPYPLVTTYYQRVRNFAYEGEKPRAQRDDQPNEHLLILEKAYGTPALTRLIGFDANDVATLKKYNGAMYRKALAEAKKPIPNAGPVPPPVDPNADPTVDPNAPVPPADGTVQPIPIPQMN